MKRWLLTSLAVVIAVGLVLSPVLPVGEYVPLLKSSEVRAQEPDGLTPGDEIIDQRTLTSKTTWLGETPTGGQRYALDASIGSVHYKDDPDDPSEQWKDIDTAIQPSDRLNWDWEVIKGNWHLLINSDTSVAVGKDGNWIGFRYEGFAYYDTSTGMYQVLDSRRDVTPTISGNKIRWDNIFYGVNLVYTYTPDRFKEDLEVTQLARDWLSANPPSSFGLNNQTSYLVGYLECDWREAYPAEDALGNAISFDNLEIEGKSIFWRHPVKDYLVTALPIGYAIHQDIEPEDLESEDLVPIRQRFYKADNGKHYLLFGSKITLLNQMPSGTIVIDPTLDPQVGASTDDAFEVEDPGTVTVDSASIPIWSSTGANSRYWGGFRFVSGGFPTSGTTIDVAYLRVYIFSDGSDDANFNIHFEELAAPAAFTTANTNITSRDRTETSVPWIADGIAAGGVGWYNSPDLSGVGSPAQELFDAYSPSAIVVIIRPNQDATKGFSAYAWDYDDNTWGAILHLEWTAVGVVAPTVTSDNSSLVEETTATLSGNITATGGENCTDRGFRWGTSTGTYTDNSTTQGDYGTGIFSADITGLTEGELYYWQAGANNTAGWGWGAEKTFLTKPDEPNSLSATGLDTQVNLTWNLGTGADNTTVRGLIGDYPADYSANTSVYDGPASSANHTGLTNGDHWYYRAWSWCTEGGLEKWSDTYSQADATPLAVPTVTSDNSTLVEETTATLSGNITDVGGANADERGFEWGTSTGVYTDNSTTSDNYSTGIYSANITGLTEGELYYWRAMAHNTSGWGYGGELTFLTKPLAPTTFSATASGDSEITLAWTKGTGADNTTITRKIDSYPTVRADGVNVYDNTGTGHVDTDNISVGTDYYYRAWSWCTEGALEQYSDTYDEDNATAYAVSAPTVASSNATSVSDTGAVLYGNITNAGNENPSLRGFEWGIGSANYSANWTEGGSFGTGAFSHSISGLSANTTYCWRAFAENSAGFGYSGELCFTTSVTPPPPPPPTPPIYVTLEFRADLDETSIRANGVPDLVFIGIEKGYGMPIWSTPANQFEQLIFNIHAPRRWTGTSDITAHIICSIDTANTDKNFQLQLAWENYTPDVDIIPITSNLLATTTATGTAAQYQSYVVEFTINYDIDAPSVIEVGDEMAFRIRRIAAPSDEISGEVIIHHLGILFERGDLLGNPDIVITEDDMEVLAGPLETLGTAGTSLMYLLVVALFGILAFWKLSAPLFMVAAGVSFMTGFYWYDAYTTNIGLTVGLMLAAYGLVCIGFAFRCIFWREDVSGN